MVNDRELASRWSEVLFASLCAFAATLVIAFAPAAPGSYERCVQSRADPFDSSVEINNVCAEILHVQFRARNERAGFCNGSWRLAPGEKDQLPLSANRLAACGGLAYAACRLGYTARDRNGAVWASGRGWEYGCVSVLSER